MSPAETEHCAHLFLMDARSKLTLAERNNSGLVETAAAVRAMLAFVRAPVEGRADLAELLKMAELRIVGMYDGISKGHGEAFAAQDDVVQKIRAALQPLSQAGEERHD
jgi:hypothetical protein